MVCNFLSYCLPRGVGLIYVLCTIGITSCLDVKRKLPNKLLLITATVSAADKTGTDAPVDTPPKPNKQIKEPVGVGVLLGSGLIDCDEIRTPPGATAIRTG